ncbi:MAG TPA: DUF1501 domain-containing protein [Candidatus Kapabacteria bacterium]|nr:DUF1501 domain-containing protein [Candidatus Kapabacteria bacterium]
MKRRTFIKTAAATAAAAPIMLGGLPVHARTSLEMLAQLPPGVNDNVLILAQLFGGNDGLNTVIPALDDEYYRIRPGIAVPKTDCWNKVGDIFLHPALALGSQGGAARMLEVGNLAIVRGVGYENPNLSHFRSTDIWLSGINDSNPDRRLDTGWLGRYLEKQYPNFPASLPDHPLAIQFAGFGLALMGSKGRMGIEVNDPSLQRGVSSQLDTLDSASAGTAYAIEYDFIADIAARSNKYAQAVKDAYAAGKTQLKAGYASDSFSQQLAAVGALLAGGLQTRVFVVSMGGFDTHVTQQYEGNKGTHPSLLETFGDAISQLQNDLIRLGFADRVVGITISEFGRRPHENGSLGTDHGAASVQFVWGTKVNSGVYGKAPDLKNLDANGDITYDIDYREVYAEILTDWFGLNTADMREVLQKDDLTPLDVLQSPASGVQENRTIAAGTGLRSYPNPFSTSATLEVQLASASDVRIDLASVDGARVATLLNRHLDAGTHRVPVNVDLRSGTYICTMRTGGHTTSHVMQCVR